MKVGVQLFAILAVGVLSTSTAFARHHSHRHSGVVAHRSGHYVNESAKTGGSTDTAPENAAITDQGHHHAAPPPVGPSGKEGPADTTIDTTIIVNQGRETTKNFKEGLVEKTKTSKTTKITGAPGVGPQHPHGLNHRQEATAGSKEGLHRNAIGAVVEHDNGGLQRNAVGALVQRDKLDAKTALGDTKPADPKFVLGKAPVIQLNPDATPKSDHGFGAVAAKIVRTSGLSLSGTGLVRPAYVTGAIGGPVQVNTGVLSGSMFHPKHP